MSDEELQEHEEEVRPMKLVLAKVCVLSSSLPIHSIQLRKLAYTIVNSPTITKKLWENTCKELNYPVRLMPRDCPTRWNSTHTMLKFAADYKEVIERLTESKDMRKFELDEEEWVMVTQLRDVFYDATTYFSSASPNIADVIPSMDFIDTSLNNAALNVDLHPAIRTATALSKRVMNKYYARTDATDVYRIAMSKSSR
ncbi:hypothetical protein BXZ70DRAFT_902952 [Cristinia sonorae]|uniref:Uncharacterized protein n=1 Tax=Cristinia sonorae TaxID=1940300 RepID=A0A8K0XJK2_9AGAR|nr:hypothetical protein BXZ70DRAFT_902952 [Cristinia sonorae]